MCFFVCTNLRQMTVKVIKKMQLTKLFGLVSYHREHIFIWRHLFGRWRVVSNLVFGDDVYDYLEIRWDYGPDFRSDHVRDDETWWRLDTFALSKTILGRKFNFSKNAAPKFLTWAKAKKILFFFNAWEKRVNYVLFINHSLKKSSSSQFFLSL